MPFGLSNKVFYIITKSFEKFPAIEKAVLFGSRAMGENKKTSDIDITVIGKNLLEKDIIKLSSILNEIEPIPYFIDILNYSDIKNKELLLHINKMGKEIYSKKKEYSK